MALWHDYEVSGLVKIGKLSMAHVHAPGYIRQIKEHPDAELVALWDEIPARGKPIAEQEGVPFYADLDEFLAHGDLMAVACDATTKLHYDVIMRAIRAGKHVFTEKALSITTAESEEIVQAVMETGIKFMISLPSRCAPEILCLKKVLDEGIIGDVTLMRARIAHSAALDGWFSGHTLWFADPEAAGGGALFDLGCHTIDVMRWLLGKPTSVMAKMNSFSGRYPAVDDNAVAVVEFESKALGILDVAWVHREGPNPIEIYGTKGFVGIRGLDGRPTLIVQGATYGGMTGNLVVRNLPEALPMPMQQWIAAIARDEPMTIDVEDGRNLTELLEGIYRSSAEGRSIDFPLT
ncbi:MAG: Gfo/Idh/MocA family protein [Candidatus Zipacnadales bacterium]